MNNYFEYLMYNGIPINEILKNNNITEKDLFKSITDKDFSKAVLYALKQHYKKYTLDSNKAIFISDTHIGNVNDDMRLLYEVYNHSGKNNIANIIHAGDFIQGSTNQPEIKVNIVQQLAALEEFFKNVQQFKTYYLIGNHEQNLVSYYYQLLQDLVNKYSNIINLGQENSYIYFKDDNNPIKINHFIPYPNSNYYNSPDFDTNLTLEGHHHIYSERDNNTFFIPPLHQLNRSITQDTGFLEIDNEDEEYVLSLYKFNNDYSIVKSKETIVKK